MASANGPLLVFGPWSLSYDFGRWHPLTPRRFGPGIDLLRAIGAAPGLAPEPAPDEDLLRCHTTRYLAAVKRLSADPSGPPEAGIGPYGDNPSFPGMHEAAAAVAGGSLRAVEAILRGDVEHAHHPGGGLHHAMAGWASGFCIYDDAALAIARARAAGLRVLYVDLDTHHGDGVQALHRDDPGVLTFSIHESGRSLFPGTGFVDELGEGDAAGTALNLPLEPFTGERPWLGAVSTLVPELAAAFSPDLIVSQHGADSHAFDPLAHLRVTTTAMGEAARLVDRAAHAWASGRWLATGGGGYDVYRVVPRAWALTWLAGAHRDAPEAIPSGWRERWAEEAARHDQAPLPERFDDPPNAGLARDDEQELAELRSAETARLVRRIAVPRILREAVDRGWWSPLATSPTQPASPFGALGEPTIVDRLDTGALEKLAVPIRLIGVGGSAATRALLLGAVGDAGVVLTAAVAGDVVVGIVVSVPRWDGAARSVVAVGVAPSQRGRGLGGALLRRHVEVVAPAGAWDAEVTVAERDWFVPLPVERRQALARRLFASAGFREVAPATEVAAADRTAAAFVRLAAA